jgi:tetratricopeptide (TPR) repeat protein
MFRLGHVHFGKSGRARDSIAVGFLSLLLALGALAVRDARAQVVQIRNSSQLPNWNQHHDYRDVYNNLPSAIPQPGGTNANGPYDTYSQLPSDARVYFGQVGAPTYQIVQPAPAAPAVRFNALDYYSPGNPNVPQADLAGGGWNCAPTATGMWMEWLRQNELPKLANRGGEVQSITDFARAADTNQKRASVTNGVGELGTARSDMIQAADDYVKASYPGNFLFGRPTIVAWNYTPNAYRHMIDRDHPPVIFFKPVGGQGGHVVVGYGYDAGTNQALVSDPWDGTDKRKGLAAIQQFNDGLGNSTRYGNPQSLPSGFNATWTQVSLVTMELPEYGTAPSKYGAAVSDSSLREWLGTGTEGTTPDDSNFPRDPLQVQDAVKFLKFDPTSGQGILQITVGSVSGMSIDTSLYGNQDEPPELYVDGWVDWNKDGSFTDNASKHIFDFSAPADFNGLDTFTLDFSVPKGFTGLTWSRFRLSRGEDVSATGETSFGSVVDYQVGVPEPASIVLVVVGLLSAATWRLLRHLRGTPARAVPRSWSGWLFADRFHLTRPIQGNCRLIRRWRSRRLDFCACWLAIVAALAGAPTARAGSILLTAEWLEEYGSATGAEGTSPGLADLDQAARSFERGESETCLKQLARAVQAQPELAPAHALFARLALLNNRTALIRPALERAIGEDPEHPEVFVLFGDLALLEGRLTDAAVHFDRVAALAASKRWTAGQRSGFERLGLQGRAAVAEARGNWKAARAALEGWLKTEPANAPARRRLGQALFRLGQRDAAYQELQRAAEQDGTLEPAAITMGRLSAQAGDPKKAEEWMDYAVQAAPDSLAVRLGLATWLLEQGRAEAAQAQAAAATRLDPRAAGGRRLLGLAARARKDLARAEPIFQALAQESPGDAWVRNQLALALAEQPDDGKRRRALELAQVSVREDPEAPDALATLGTVSYRLQRLGEAEKALQRALASGRGSSDAAYILARVQAERGHAEAVPGLLAAALEVPGVFLARQEARQWLDRLNTKAR